jgi:hypothetical protein
MLAVNGRERAADMIHQVLPVLSSQVM